MASERESEVAALPDELRARIEAQRRRFLGAAALFLVSALLLPWVMDAEPPASLRAPEVRWVASREEALQAGSHAPPQASEPIVERSEEQPAPASSAAGGNGRASEQGQPVQSVAAPAPVSKSAEPGPAAAQPAANEAPRAAAMRSSGSEGGSQPAGAVPRENPQRSAALAVDVPQWNAARISERVRAQSALAGREQVRQYWYVQVAAFREVEVAAETVGRLRGKGFEAYLAPDRDWQRVRVGPFLSEAEAQTAANELARVVRAKPQVVAVRVP